MEKDLSINQEEVNLSKKWLQKFVIPRKTTNKSYNTYQLKHCAEKSFGTACYISHESFVQAAKELNYKISKNGYLKADYSIAKKYFEKSMIHKPY